MLELDCHLTSDSQVVVSHDQNLARVCGLDIDISKTPYCELPLLKLEVPVDFDLGKFVKQFILCNSFSFFLCATAYSVILFP